MSLSTDILGVGLVLNGISQFGNAGKELTSLTSGDRTNRDNNTKCVQIARVVAQFVTIVGVFAISAGCFSWGIQLLNLPVGSAIAEGFMKTLQAAAPILLSGLGACTVAEIMKRAIN